MISITNFIAIALIGFINGQANGTTTREPSIQAYGLPKRFFTDNGYIERTYLGDVTDGKSADVIAAKDNTYPGDPSNKKNKFEPVDWREDGTIEFLHLDSRKRRTIENHRRSSNSENIKDMQAEESKVFRPLFVYRQQVAKRQRIQRERNIGRDPKLRYNSNSVNSLRYYPRSG